MGGGEGREGGGGDREGRRASVELLEHCTFCFCTFNAQKAVYQTIRAPVPCVGCVLGSCVVIYAYAFVIAPPQEIRPVS